ncbi:MAG: DUF1552 domain-containing protein [Polyangiaceae bacterium]|nr:DUF1552 domain-containing protein [Polyangiaceae bacterium]
MLSKSLLKRRELMMSMGAAGFLAVPLFRESFVEAQAASFPVRFVVLHIAGGVYFPTGTEGLGGWTFDKVLKPLAGLQSESIQIHGSNNDAGAQMWSQSNEPHGAAMRGLLTGDSSVPDAGVAKWALTDSIDQQIADKIGGTVKFPSLQFGVSTRGAQIDQMRISFRGGSALPPIDSPATMFSRLFSGATPTPTPQPTTTSTGTATTPPVAPPVDTGARGRSMLDVLKNEIVALKAVGGVNEQQKLDQHLESLRALEQQLGPAPGPGGGTGGGGGGVNVPPPVVGTGCMTPNVGNPTDVPNILPAQFDLLYQSLVCDLSRVASVQMLCSAQSGIAFPYIGVSDNHHDLEHSFNPALDKVQTYFVDQMAVFMNRLKATPEGNGNMLDNTLILLCSEFGAAGDHNHSLVPYTTFGRAGGKVTPGRTLDYGEASNNLVLRSILQPFGIDKPIGDTNLNAGTVLSLA